VIVRTGYASWQASRNEPAAGMRAGIVGMAEQYGWRLSPPPAVVNRETVRPERPVILAIDPGSSESGWALLRGETVLESGKDDNTAVLAMLREMLSAGHIAALVLERFSGYGLRRLGESSIETILWTGRYWQVAEGRVPVEWVRRQTVKAHLCGRANASDADVISALVDRYGGIGGRPAAVGTLACPGPLHGVRRDAWQALAAGLTHQDTLTEETR